MPYSAFTLMEFLCASFFNLKYLIIQITHIISEITMPILSNIRQPFIEASKSENNNSDWAAKKIRPVLK